MGSTLIGLSKGAESSQSFGRKMDQSKDGWERFVGALADMEGSMAELGIVKLLVCN